MIDLGKITCVEECAHKLAIELHNRFDKVLEQLHYVIIERQPRARSIIMVAVQMFLCMHFSTMSPDLKIKFSSASRKLDMKFTSVPLIDESIDADDDAEVGQSSVALPVSNASKTKIPRAPVSKYAANKSYAVETTRLYLERAGDFANLSLLEAYSKKDDLCDAFLQAVAFIENDGVCSRPTSYKRKTRKNEKQKPALA